MDAYASDGKGGRVEARCDSLFNGDFSHKKKQRGEPTAPWFLPSRPDICHGTPRTRITTPPPPASPVCGRWVQEAEWELTSVPVISPDEFLGGVGPADLSFAKVTSRKK